MKSITLRMPYYYSGKRYYKITIQAVAGFVDVLDGDGNIIYSGYTVDGINFINDLRN